MPQRIVLPLDIEIHARDAFIWPDAFPGVVARGVLTSALAFRVCSCHSRDDGSPHHPDCPAADLLNAAKGGGRRYALGPVEMNDRALRFRLFLYGPAARSYDRLADALDALVHHGVGDGRNAAEWCTMSRAGDVFYDTREGVLSFPGEPDRIAAPWIVCPLGKQSMELELATPLDLSWKRQSDPAAALSAAGLARAFLHRWSAIDDGVKPTPPAMIRKQAEAWTEAIAASELRLADANWFSTIRHSAHQRRDMTFRGLLGRIRIDSANGAVASLAAALELLPIGGRTAFGFGTIRTTV